VRNPEDQKQFLEKGRFSDGAPRLHGFPEAFGFAQDLL
jgi:hypothetical protein